MTMNASAILLLALCSSMFFLHGANCHRFPKLHSFLKGLRMPENQEYKRQTDVDQCIDDELDDAGVDSACKLVGESDIDFEEASQAEINALFSQFCRPECGNPVLRAIEDCEDIDEDERIIINFIASLCGTNEDGERCYQQYTRLSSHFAVEASCYENFAENGVCSCKSDLQEEVEEQGCCLDAYQDFISDILDEYDPSELYSECGVDRPGGCNNSPISGSVPLVSTITTTAAVIVSFALALAYP